MIINTYLAGHEWTDADLNPVDGTLVRVAYQRAPPALTLDRWKLDTQKQIDTWTEAVEDWGLYLRMAVNDLGQVCTIWQHQHDGPARVRVYVREGGVWTGHDVSCPVDAYGQNCVEVVNTGHSWYVWVQTSPTDGWRAFLLAESRQWSAAETFTFPATSQGFLEGHSHPANLPTVTMTDDGRDAIAGLLLPNTAQGFAVGQKPEDPPGLRTACPGAVYFTVSHGPAYEPHVTALPGAWYAVTARTPYGAQLSWCHEPFIDPVGPEPGASAATAYLGYLYDHGKYGDFAPARNCTVLGAGMYGDSVTDWPDRIIRAAEAAGSIFLAADACLERCGPAIWDRVHGVWIHEPTSPEDARAQVADAHGRMATLGLPQRPVVAILTTAAALDPAYADCADWLALEIYHDYPAGTFADQYAETDALIMACVTHGAGRGTAPLILMPQAYDRNLAPAWIANPVALEAIQDVCHDWLARFAGPRLRGLWWFAYARPGGTKFYPRVEAWHAAQVAVTRRPSLPIDPPPPGSKPRLTISEPATFPVRVIVGQGVRCVWKEERGTGPITHVEWLARQTGTTHWIVNGKKRPASDRTHTYKLPLGAWEIKLRGYGPGGIGETGRTRIIEVV